MLLKHSRICSRISEQCLKNHPTRRSLKTCHHNSTVNSICLRIGHRANSSPVSCTSTRGLHVDKKPSYVRGSDSEKARKFLLQYHEKTMRKYGVPEEEKRRDRTSLQGSSQCRVVPKFLQHAHFFNGRHYFCPPDPETGLKQLVRFRMSSNEETVLCKDLDNLCEVRDLIHSGRYLAVLVSSDSESRIFIIEESTGELIRTINSGHQIQWISESKLVYTSINNNMRPDTATFLNLETGEPETVYRSTREDEVVSVTCSKDKRFTAVNVNTKLTSHVYVLDNMLSEWKCCVDNLVNSRDQNSKCYIEHHKDRLIAIKSSDTNPNLHLYWSDKITKTPGSTLPKTETFHPHHKRFGVIHEVEAFDSGIVVYHTTLDSDGNKGKMRLTLLDPENYSQIKSIIDFPADVSLVTPNSNSSPDQTHLKICVHSYTKPVKQLSIPFSKFKISRGRLISRGRYEMITDTAPSGDVDVPITIIASEDSLTDCTPCLFLTYGCYGENLFFSWETLPRQLLDQGWKVVLCNVRGGGECGRDWYLQGVGLKKKNSVLDTLNCIKHVQSLNLTTPRISTLHASSSGALIAARAALSVPGIVNKLVLRFPFLDLHTAMSDKTLPLSSEEREEWGYDLQHPDSDLDLFESSNVGVESGLLITVAGKDRRAPPWHAANLVASTKNISKVYVNFLEDADHSGFEEDADAMETHFMLDSDEAESYSFWSRLKDFSLFSK